MQISLALHLFLSCLLTNLSRVLVNILVHLLVEVLAERLALVEVTIVYEVFLRTVCYRVGVLWVTSFVARSERHLFPVAVLVGVSVKV